MSVYSVLSIKRSEPPAGQQGGNWYCYIIASAHNTIIGYRRGALHEVKTIAGQCVTSLNQKHKGLPPRDFVRRAYPVQDNGPFRQL